MKPLSPAAARWIGLLVLFLLPVVGLWPVLSHPDEVLAFNDGNIEAALSPQFTFPASFLSVWDNQFFFGQAGGQYALSVAGFGESILGPHHMRREGVAMVLSLCGLAVYWFIRQFNFSRFTAVATAAVIMLAGFSFSFAVVGLYMRPVGIACGALSLGFAERGRCGKGWLNYALAGGFLGLAVAEVPDVGALLAICCAVYVAWSHLFLGNEFEQKVAKVTKELKKSAPTAALTELSDSKATSATASDSAPSSLGALRALLFDSSSSSPTLPRFAPRRLLRLAAIMTVYIAFSVLLAWQTVGLMFQTQIKGVTQGMAEDPQARYDWATQWSVPKAETWDFVASSYFGTSMHSEKAPYWGGLGRSAEWDTQHKGFRNFKLTGWQFGVAPSILLVALAVSLLIPARRRLWDANSRRLAWFVLAMIAVTLMFSWGRYFPAYRLVYALPFFSTIRNPDKWIEPLTLFASLGMALVLHNMLRRDEAGKALRTSLRTSCALAAAGIAAIALVLLLKDMGRQAEFAAGLTSQGFGDIGQQAWDHAVATSTKVLFLALAVGGVCWFASLRPAKPVIPAAVLAGTLAVLAGLDLLHANSFYVQRHAYKAMLAPNPLTTFLDAHKGEGRLKLLPAQNPLLNNLRLTILFAKGYDLFDPVSVSRMPSDYAAFFAAFDKNPIRMWELAGIRYFLTLPGAIDQLNLMDRPGKRFVERLALGIGIADGQYIPSESTRPDQRPLRVVEFTGALPKYRLVSMPSAIPETAAGNQEALDLLTAPELDVTRESIVHGIALPDLQPTGSNGTIRIETETPRNARLVITCDSPRLLVRAVKFHKDWNAIIDGKPAPLLRVNYCFQGLWIESGTHTVAFEYLPSKTLLLVACAGRLLLLAGILCAILAGRRNVPPWRHKGL